jgi:hypothetical protein
VVQPFDIFDLLSDTEEGRRIAFQTELGKSPLANFTNNAQLSNLFQPFQNQFFANQGQRIQNEQSPQSFTDFLNNDFDLDRQIRRAPSQQTGRSPSRFSGPARFLFQR